MMAAAKELGIVVVESQHGLIHKYHTGYMYGKHLLKYKDKFPVPDYILTFGDYYTRLLLKNSFYNEKQVITVGNPRIDYWKSEMESENKVFRNAFITMGGYHPLIIVNFLKEVLEILEKEKIDAIVALGAVVQGKTYHDILIMNTIIPKLMDMSLQYKKPLGMGIIGPRVTWKQAEERASEYAERAVKTAIEMVKTIKN